MPDDGFEEPRYQLYIIGAKLKFWERVRDENGAPITPTACNIKLLNRDTGVEVTPVETVRLASGIVSVTLPHTYMTTPGNYRLEWDVAYTSGSDTPTITLFTDIIARYSDSTYLMSLVSRLRVWADDDPDDPNDRIKTDEQLKRYMVEAVRYKMSSYSITKSSGQDEITPEPTAGGDDESLLVLWGAWLYYKFGFQAIASERTRMFSITYAQAFDQLSQRLQEIENEIIKLDATQAMYFDSVSSIEYYGDINTLTTEAMATWDT